VFASIFWRKEKKRGRVVWEFGGEGESTKEGLNSMREIPIFRKTLLRKGGYKEKPPRGL